MSIQLRIKELRESAKMTQKEFSQVIGVDNSQYSKIEQGKIQPTIQQIMEISSNFNVTTDWLLTGKKSKGDIDADYKKNNHTDLVAESAQPIYNKKETTSQESTFASERLILKYRPRPHIDAMYATLGTPNGFALAVKEDECEQLSIPFVPNYDFSIKGRGDSMINRNNPNKSINEGDLIACKLWTSRSHIRWGQVYALSTTEGVVVKQIMPAERAGYILCVSFNEEDGYMPYEIPLEEVYDWALVVSVIHITSF